MLKLILYLKQHRKIILYLIIGLFLVLYWSDLHKGFVAKALEAGYVEEEIPASQQAAMENLPLNAANGDYEQTFVCKYSTLYGIRLPLTVGQASAQDRITVTVCQEDGAVLVKKDLVPDAQMEFDTRVLFDTPQEHAKNQGYTVHIQATQVDANSVLSLGAMNRNVDADNGLRINHQMATGQISLTQVLYPSAFLRKLSMLLLMAVLGIFVVLCVCMERMVSWERMCIPLVIVLSLLYSAVITPLAVPDEVTHFYSAYSVSNSLMHKEGAREAGILVREEDADYSEFAFVVTRSTYLKAAQGIMSSQELMGETQVALEPVETASYFYLAPAIGITVARLLHLSFVQLMYLGRLCNTILYALLVYLGLKKMPFAKEAYLIAAITPMALHQSCSFSYDSPILGLSFALIGTSLGLAYAKDEVKVQDIILPMVLGALLAPAKSGAYLPICFLAFLIPKEKFTSKRNYALSIVGMIGIAIVIFGAQFALHSVSTLRQSAEGTIYGGGQRLPTYTLEDLIHTPFSMLAIFVSTFLRTAGEWLLSEFGYLMAARTMRIENLWVIGYMLVLFLASLPAGEEKMPMRMWHRAWIALIVVGSMSLAMLGMLVGWTPRGNDVIGGVQGRYFLPLLPLAVLLLKNDALALRENHGRAYVTAAAVLNFLILFYAFGTSVGQGL